MILRWANIVKRVLVSRRKNKDLSFNYGDLGRKVAFIDIFKCWAQMSSNILGVRKIKSENSFGNA